MTKIIAYFFIHRRLSFFFAIIWTILILIGCSLPGKDLPAITLFDHFDKVVHFTFFCFFYFLWYAGTKPFENKSLILILISFALGFAIEFYQINFVVGRSFDVWDGVADTFGAWAASFIMKKWGLEKYNEFDSFT